MKPVAGLLKTAVVHKATDLYLRTDRVPALRIGARTRFLDEPATPGPALAEWALALGLAPPERLQGVYEIAGLGRFRVLGAIDQAGRLNLCIRVHPAWPEGQGPVWIGLPEAIGDDPVGRGWLIVSGAPGSGRSTLLHELARRTLARQPLRVIHVAPWPELEYRDHKGIVEQWGVGRDLDATLRLAVRSGADLLCLDLPEELAVQLPTLRAAVSAGLAVWTTVSASGGAEAGRMLSQAGEPVAAILQLYRLRAQKSDALYAVVPHRPGRSAGAARAQVEDGCDQAEASALAGWVREGRISRESATLALGQGVSLDLVSP